MPAAKDKITQQVATLFFIQNVAFFTTKAMMTIQYYVQVVDAVLVRKLDVHHATTDLKSKACLQYPDS
ncbi:hypothetical protein Leryth_014545 [Lithospermum erythrorhizon]|nr:hypothetical protein Leryth_014545 [Lithospermum erythrorhizon]